MLKEYDLLDNQGARIQVVPLFETVEDLENSREIMKEFLNLDIVKNGLLLKTITKKLCSAILIQTKTVAT